MSPTSSPEAAGWRFLNGMSSSFQKRHPGASGDDVAGAGGQFQAANCVIRTVGTLDFHEFSLLFKENQGKTVIFLQKSVKTSENPCKYRVTTVFKKKRFLTRNWALHWRF